MALSARSLLAFMALGLPPAPAMAQGIVCEAGAVVFHGSSSNASHPATIDMKKVEKETPEYKTIKSEGVKKGSARYEILLSKMHERIKNAARLAAEARGCDCVVRSDDVKDARGLALIDLSKEVIDLLESADAGH